MSRLAIHPIDIPENTDVSVDGDTIVVSGKEGEIQQQFKPTLIAIAVDDDTVELSLKQDTREARRLWGTYASIVKNMIHGVNEKFEKELAFTGIGYQARVKGNTLELELGYSHPIELEIPDGIDVEVDGSEITVAGVDKERVGQFAARIRNARPPEPYKGKGVQYKDETIRRKEGKKAV
jgi:large subunit ribosomal protein L6